MNALSLVVRALLLALVPLALAHCSDDGGGSSPPPGGTGGFPPGAGGFPPGAGGFPPGAGGFPPGGGGFPPGAGGVPPGAGGAPTGGTGGIGGGGGSGGIILGGGGCESSPNRAAGFMNLAPPAGAPLDPAAATALNPPAPMGWSWFPIDGTQCRDGSPNGIFVRFTESDKLLIYFEGGGACVNSKFCFFNPPNVNVSLAGSGQDVLGSAAGAVGPRQQPGVFTPGVMGGVFDSENAANPFQNWNMVYIPYCTGDVHFGTRTDVMVPLVAPGDNAGPFQFVGASNTQKFVSRIVPTFKDKVNKVIVTGVSAGSFGAALNYSMIQDAFCEVPVDGLMDSGVPFTDMYMPVCMQQRWREVWGLNGALPPDCDECFRSDGGGLLGMADFLIEKHQNAKLGLISTLQDQVIRLFFSPGLNDCANYDTGDPVPLFLAAADPNVYYSTANYQAAIEEVRALYAGTGRFATYLIGAGADPFQIEYHQHIFRQRFYEAPAAGKTIAQFVTEFIGGTVTQHGP